jgi:hypothetical protein
MPENHQAKGRRYLTEGRVYLRSVGPDGIRATCRGQGQLYRLGWERGRGWWCDCPALTRCAHLVALQLVAIAPNGRAVDG